MRRGWGGASGSDGANDRSRQRARSSGGPSIPERVAQVYYTHGVFCATHPYSVIVIAISFVLLCCVPLLTLPLPSNVPQTYTEVFNTTSMEDPPRWYTSLDSPVYIQQIIMKSAVSPWKDGLYLTDAIRAPIAEAFRLIESIQNYQHHPSGLTLRDVCVRVEEPAQPSPLPQYNCLILSPANFWKQDPQQFYSDTNIISTIYNYQGVQVGKASLTELLFGVSLKEAGIKRYPLRNRQRIIQFAVTILMTQYNHDYISGLKNHLVNLYPLNQDNVSESSPNHHEIVHLFYKGDFDFHEFLPLFFTYMVLFFYMYFSVRKIELVRSKVGMALSALFTVLGSLLMSIGLCLFFGLDPAGSSRGREVFPYLVVVVGLENILVLTKSVVSTQPHLDSKIRVAQGLSKEGWSITKNLLTEVTILTAGLLTLVPAIQEFCIFAVVGLLCDFFLQMCFFSTVLSLDMRGIEAGPGGGMGTSKSLYSHEIESRTSGRFPRSRSTPRLHDYPPGIEHRSGGSHGSRRNQPPLAVKIPKRLRLVYFWARTRIVQRAFMICMVIWIGGIVYSAGIVHRLVPLPEGDLSSLDSAGQLLRQQSPVVGSQAGKTVLGLHDSKPNTPYGTEPSVKLKQGYAVWASPWATPLTPVKWCYLVNMYNSSTLRGSGSGSGSLYWDWGVVTTYNPCRLASLEPIKISAAVLPSRAEALRNPLEPPPRPFKWTSLALALDPHDYQGDSESPSKSGVSGAPFLPTSPLEVLLVTVLCMVSIIVIGYTALALYHLVCSRNYAQWRSQGWWSSGPAGQDTLTSTQVVLQAMPQVLEGHKHAVEWLATDGNTIVSSCLIGELNVWDASSGERLALIDRRRYFACEMAPQAVHLVKDDQVPSDYESGSPPTSISTSQYDPLSEYKRWRSGSEGTEVLSELSSHRHPPNKVQWMFPDLSPIISTDFSKSRPLNRESVDPSKGFDFGYSVNRIYSDFDGDSTNGEEEEGVGSSESMDHSLMDFCPSIWCMDAQANLLVLGTSSGRLEFWEPSTAQFKCIFDDSCGVGVTCIRLAGGRAVAARLTGSLEIFALEWGSHYGHPTSRRTHARTGSVGRIDDLIGTGELRCVRLGIVRAHHQPITQLVVEAGRILTGSHDHTVKVFSMIDHVFTLHGHCGPITALFVDAMNPMTAGSGSHDGMLCVWDLLTGACVYSLEAHDGPVTALTYSVSYVISLGADERLCVWDRFQGHLLNTIQVLQAYCTSMVMISHNLLVTSKQGSLVIWDVQLGEPVKMIKLGDTDGTVFTKTVLPLRDGVACDYSNQLRIVKFPLVREKSE